ncbi:unnamed protein product [Clonostachys chloroleuca]|uniref:Uncharacterized protein n=1 Tax=Clonostachys chloroleuca TaxID=1926264 RepID=A0AA35Q3K9_9HYPO|nr:unnamed protein product [Clonostachys chloroleuca]
MPNMLDESHEKGDAARQENGADSKAAPSPATSDVHYNPLKPRRLTRAVTDGARRLSGKTMVSRRSTLHSDRDITVDLSWYSLWLSSRVQNLPPAYRQITLDGKQILEPGVIHRFMDKVGQYVKDRKGLSVDNIIEYLQSTNSIDHSDSKSLNCVRGLIFSILGWQSMLYQPDLTIGPSTQLAIYHDDTLPDSRLVFFTYKMSTNLCDRPLFALLKGFGNLLPAGYQPPQETSVLSKKAVASWIPLYPSDVNAYLLTTLLGVRFRWVDSIALHLDFDKSSRTLSLFCFPSICASQLRDGGSIFAFASMEAEAADPRANESDITHLLGEILLSYRLLFGQSKKSRKVFRQTFDPQKLPCPQPDTLLAVLCSQKQVPAKLGDFPLPVDRHIYYAARDFSVLHDRVELLFKELNGTRPKSISGLLKDRRDTLQFWTFWLVGIFGSLSVTLTFAQVVMQAYQVSQGN